MTFKSCSHCSKPFEITDADVAFYEKISPTFDGKKVVIPPPTLCPQCRDQRRLTFRNERSLYQTKSSRSGEPLISYLSPDKPYKVYSQKEWWSDDWDPTIYGRDFDFNRPFFEQFNTLLHDVPRMNLLIWQSENSDYCNFIDFCKNCYLTFGASNCENVYYSNLADSDKDCVDCSGCKNCELCYDSIDCIRCYNILASIQCKNSTNLAFCFDCHSCQDCVGCFNLKYKKYCLFNVQYSKEEYDAKKAAWSFAQREIYDALEQSFLKNIQTRAIHRAGTLLHTENCSGDHLTHSKNTHFSFESDRLEDCKWANFSMNCKDSFDIFGSSKKGVERTCEGMCIEGKNILSGFYIAGYSNIYYSDFVVGCHDVFGCAGLKRKQYCILNKQYSREEYEKLALKIAEHMQKTGEWGEFFPDTLSPFEYGETVAQDYYPLPKIELFTSQTNAKNSAADPNSNACKSCGKFYKIIPQEQEFYQKLNVPTPTACPSCRHQKRLSLKNPHELWGRPCFKCNEIILSPHRPESSKLVYCQKCYLKIVGGFLISLNLFFW
ncbi:MAG: hypothetical protein WC882_02630 [Candidatus Gracilibacteria bacterium]